MTNFQMTLVTFGWIAASGAILYWLYRSTTPNLADFSDFTCNECRQNLQAVRYALNAGVKMPPRKPPPPPPCEATPFSVVCRHCGYSFSLAKRDGNWTVLQRRQHRGK